MTSFILSRYPVPKPVFDQIDAQLAYLAPEPRRFLLHVLASNVLNFHRINRHDLHGWLDLSIELPVQWIHEHFGRHFDLTSIPPALLTITPYSTAANRCRSFRAADALLLPLLEWAPASTLAASQIPLVNLFSGEPHERRKLMALEGGVQCTKPIRDAVAVFDECPFNGAALDAHLLEMEQRWRSAPAKDAKVEEARFRNDRACAIMIRTGCVASDDATICSYRPEYRPSYTGRVIEIGGAAQSCSRAMKVALFEGTSNLRNYDLKAAQVYILKQELEDAGLPRRWVEKYLSEPKAAATRAAVLGITKDAFKKCLFATIMGAVFEKNPKPKKNAIFDAMLDEAAGDAARAKQLMIAVHRELKGLKREVGAFRRHLLTAPNCARLDPTRKKVRTLLNACGQRFPLDGDTETVLARKAVAFILQGQEAAFIHKVTTIGAKHGFVPVNNQHDGLVVLGEVPDAAVAEAANATGLRYPHLDQKAFQ
jgi:hypothetical protein